MAAPLLRLTFPQSGSGLLETVDAEKRDRVMWSISSEDIERAKERLQLRRSEIEARYAGELRALDAELETITRLERAATEFAAKGTQEDVAPDFNPEAPAETAPGSGGDLPGSASAERREGSPGAGSRWRLHLGSRPADAEGANPLVSAPR